MQRRELLKMAAAVGVTGPLLASAAANADAGAASASATHHEKASSTMSTGLSLANLRGAGKPRLAVKTEKGILDVAAAAKAHQLNVPADTDDLIANGEQQLKACVSAALAAKGQEHFIAEKDAQFAPAVTRPGKIICIGLNYRKHAKEIGMPEPKEPPIFTKFRNALTHHGATVPTKGLPNDHFDYEVELVVVIGKRAVQVSEASALDYVFGYATGNDFSERASQTVTSQWTAGKTSDGFAPLGPYLLTADLVGNPNALKLETHVNGELRQSSSTADFIFNTQQIIAYCSKLFPLEPGDIIFTGTPEGVVMGMPKEKQVWLKTGDQVVTTIEKTGALEITVG
jgi:2-keto-4-pentenoate hydratase/2-oxohepta-3-ene-1,7-dioic acid hydratase in catechol pathway